MEQMKLEIAKTTKRYHSDLRFVVETDHLVRGAVVLKHQLAVKKHFGLRVAL